MRDLKFESNKVIFRKGDQSDSMYLIKSGVVGVYANYGEKNCSEIAVLGKGKFFGEMGVIENAPRNADVVAIDDTQLIEIKADDFSSFVVENTRDVIKMMEDLSSRIRTTTANLENTSKIVSEYEGKADDKKDKSSLSGIAALYTKLFGAKRQKEREPKMNYEKGEILFEQGDIGDCMFIVLDGEVGIYHNYGKAGEEKLTTVGKGSIFGEMAVIDSERRSATVVAETNVEVNTVVNAKLRSFLEGNPQDGIKILRSLSSKLRSTTEQYIEVLRIASEYFEKENALFGSFAPGDYAAFAAMEQQYHAMSSCDSIYPTFVPYNMNYLIR